jgi:aldehyde:ferredoxin oxidoreductase
VTLSRAARRLDRFGYHGKILHIDLSNLSWTVEEPPETFWRIYAGGGLLATYYLMKLAPPGVDAFDPANPLILTTSVAAGQPFAGLARFTAAAKSPLTGGVGEARAEGPFARALKGSGYDAIIIRGATANPISLLIDDGEVSFHDASNLWGRPVSETVAGLNVTHGAGIETACIGPAGENRVRFASIVSAGSYQAARMGLGAVMGSKGLKAVAVRGDRLPPVADHSTCAEMTAAYARRMMNNPLTRWQFEPPGFAAWVHVHGTDAALCTRNYRDSVFEGAAAYGPPQFQQHYLHDGNCPGCPNACIKFFGGGPGTETIAATAGGIHQEITGALGPNLGLSDVDDVLRANILCNELGLDPVSLGFTLSMAMECAERGIGVPTGLAFGDGPAVLTMIPKIARREGFGDVLAEGAARAARTIGPEAQPFALTVKGLEMTAIEPRTQTNLALGYAVAPIGPRYDICEHDWDFDPHVGWPHSLENSRTLGILERLPMEYLGPHKVRNFKALSILWSAADALDLCVFAVAPTRVFSLDEMAALVAAVTGWKISGHEIMRWGERRLHLMRIYNLREGLTCEDDRLPDRFHDEPIHEGKWAGTILDRTSFREVIATYYQMMGWDDKGHPLPATLIDHHLDWVIPEEARA